MSEVALAHMEGDGLETSRTVRLRVPARPEYVALARLTLSGLADLAPLSDDDVADLKLALTEAVSNSVGNADSGGDGFVSVTYGLSATALEIEVTDDGRLGERGSRLRFVKRLRSGL
jgi:serine/threonine-protein kinase RsbW